MQRRRLSPSLPHSSSSTTSAAHIHRVGIGAIALTAGLTMAGPVKAVGTRTFALETLEELSGGDLKGVAVGSDGIVRAGLTLGNLTLKDTTTALTSLTLADGSALIGTSPDGKIYRVQGESITLFADTKELAVTSMVQAPNGTVYAATIPNGKVFRIAQDKADVLVALKDADHVWALCLDKEQSHLLATTGPEGKLFRIGFDGTASVLFDSDAVNLVGVAVDPKTGDVLTGSGQKAVLYRVSAPGKTSVVYDFPGDEITSIAPSRDGGWFVVANDFPEPPEAPKRGSNAGRTPGAPTTAARPKPGKGRLYKVDAAGRVEKLMGHDEFHYSTLAVDETGAPLVGTGGEGRIYTASDTHAVTLLADTDERQIVSISMGRGQSGPILHAMGSDPAVFHRVVSRGGPDSTWTSKVLDAGLRARFGHVTWEATGAFDIATRSGNTATPDTTWSPWSDPIAQGGLSLSPAGRYVQVRAKFRSDKTATLRSLRLPFITENARPIVTEVTALQRGTTRSSKEGLVASGGELPKHDSIVHIAWKVDNADNDTLRFQLRYRRDGQSTYRELAGADDIVGKSEFDWDTQVVAEGRYRIRVEASDDPANPPEQALRHALESPVVLVDNTAPLLREVSLTGRRLRAHVVDTLGPIARAEVAIDGRPEYRPIAAADGLFDTAEEMIDTDLTPLVPPGSHVVTVRAFDAAGNAVLAEVEAR